MGKKENSIEFYDSSNDNKGVIRSLDGFAIIDDDAPFTPIYLYNTEQEATDAAFKLGYFNDVESRDVDEQMLDVYLEIHGSIIWKVSDIFKSVEELYTWNFVDFRTVT